VICVGIQSQMLAPATGKARRPTVSSLKMVGRRALLVVSDNMYCVLKDIKFK